MVPTRTPFSTRAGISFSIRVVLPQFGLPINARTGGIKNPLNGQIVTRCFARAAMSGWPPITYRGNFQHLVFAVQPLQTVMYPLPDTGNLRVDLTFTILGTAAGTVQKTF